MTFLIVWLLIGLVSSFISIAKFRPNGTAKPEELYLAAVGPFFGPIVALLLCVDIIRTK